MAVARLVPNLPGHDRAEALEGANSLQMALRRGRIDAAFRDAALADFTSLDLLSDSDTGAFAWSTTLQLADRCRLTLYDAAYLELAQRMALPLATLDRRLHQAADTLGIGLQYSEPKRAAARLEQGPRRGSG